MLFVAGQKRSRRVMVALEGEKGRAKREAVTSVPLSQGMNVVRAEEGGERREELIRRGRESSKGI